MLDKPIGSSARLINETRPNPSFYADRAGTYVIELKVDDGTDVSTDQVSVDVVAPNRSPVASAGPDQTVSAGARVVLNGSSSYDPDGARSSSRGRWCRPRAAQPPCSTRRPRPCRSSSPTCPGCTSPELVVADGTSSSQPDQVRITAQDGGGDGGAASPARGQPRAAPPRADGRPRQRRAHRAAAADRGVAPPPRLMLARAARLRSPRRRTRLRPRPVPPPRGRHDFEVGALAAVDDAGCVRDAGVHGADPLVRDLGEGLVAVVERGLGDAARLYAAGDHRHPRSEVVVAPQGNVHDVARSGGGLWWAPYERARYCAPTSATRGAIRWTSPPGPTPTGYRSRSASSPRPRAWCSGCSAWCARARCGQPDEGCRGASPRRSGRARGGGGAARSPTPSSSRTRPTTAGCWRFTGRFGVPDGGLVEVDLATGTVTTLLREDDLGFDLSAAAGLGDALVLLGVGFAVDGPSRLLCCDLATGAVTAGPTSEGWLVDAVAGDTTASWVERHGFAGDRADALLAVDPATCAVEGGSTISPSRPYARLAWVPE
ncbi:MAG: hypothetical protein R3F59_11250 [Myxococcota bacterium]